MKKIALYNSNIEETIKKSLTDCQITTIEKIKDFNDFDIVILNDYNGELPLQPSSTTVLNIHPSLLPAFEGENAIENALKFGVKVSGITIQNVYTKQIIAQFPVLIGIDTGVNEFISEMTEIEKYLIPTVIQALLEDRVFDFNDLFNNPCKNKGGCSGCGGCH
jgi:folate-dependent phosphoribosylglycinamide formyltransferase PurN